MNDDGGFSTAPARKAPPRQVTRDRLGNYVSPKREWRRKLAGVYAQVYGRRMSSRQWRKFRRVMTRMIAQQQAAQAMKPE